MHEFDRIVIDVLEDDPKFELNVSNTSYRGGMMILMKVKLSQETRKLWFY